MCSFGYFLETILSSVPKALSQQFSKMADDSILQGIYKVFFVISTVFLRISRKIFRRFYPDLWKGLLLITVLLQLQSSLIRVYLVFSYWYLKFYFITLFLCLHASSTTRGAEFGELETVMQTRDPVEVLHNFREFSQPPKCLDEAVWTRKKYFVLL